MTCEWEWDLVLVTEKSKFQDHGAQWDNGYDASGEILQKLRTSGKKIHVKFIRNLQTIQTPQTAPRITGLIR